MNTKGIKFLAVLAVLAMAFAAFSIVAPAEENDAADADNIAVATAESVNGSFYVNADLTLTATITSTSTYYVKDGAKLTLAGASGTVKIYAVQSATPNATTPANYDITKVADLEVTATASKYYKAVGSSIITDATGSTATYGIMYVDAQNGVTTYYAKGANAGNITLVYTAGESPKEDNIKIINGSVVVSQAVSSTVTNKVTFAGFAGKADSNYVTITAGATETAMVSTAFGSDGTTAGTITVNKGMFTLENGSEEPCPISGSSKCTFNLAAVGTSEAPVGWTYIADALSTIQSKISETNCVLLVNGTPVVATDSLDLTSTLGVIPISMYLKKATMTSLTIKNDTFVHSMAFTTANAKIWNVHIEKPVIDSIDGKGIGLKPKNQSLTGTLTLSEGTFNVPKNGLDVGYYVSATSEDNVAGSIVIENKATFDLTPVEIPDRTTPGIVTVQPNGSITNKGNITIPTGATLDTKQALSGNGTVSVAGTFIACQNASKLLAIDNNKVTVSGAMKVVEYGGGDTYNIVGTEPSTNYDSLVTDKALFAVGTGGGTVTIQETWNGTSLTGTTYTLDGPISIGATTNGTTPINNYFTRADVLQVTSGITKFTVGTTLGDGVSLIIDEGAAFTGKVTGGNIKTDSGESIKVVTPEDIVPGTTEVADIVKNNGTSESSITVNGVVATSIAAKEIKVEQADVAFVSDGTTVALDNVKIEITATGAGSKEVSFSGFTGGVSGTIVTTDGTNKSTLKLENVKGTFIVSKGSIVVKAVSDFSGDIIIDKGDVLKLSGTITGATNVKLSSAGTATVMVEAGEDKALAVNAALTLAAGISMEVYGTMTGAAAITAPAGVVIYSGADIAGYTNEDSFNAFTGSDGNGGKWSYATAGKVLTLENYNGTYQFKNYKITSIVLVGDNSISYAAAATPAAITVFGGNENVITSITTVQGTASLTIDVDMSKATALNGGLVVVKAGALEIDAIALEINVTGYNSDWTETIIENGAFKGIDAISVDIYNADLDMSIMAAYSAAAGYGIYTTGAVKFTSCLDITIGASGKAILIIGDNALTIKDTAVSIAGQVLGAELGGALTIQNYAALLVNSGMEVTGAVSVSQQATLTVDDLFLKGALTNYGNIVTTGNVVIGPAGSFTNNAYVINSGVIGVYGVLTNGTDGEFANTGTVNVFKYKLPEADISVQMPNEAASTTGSLAKLYKITVDYSKMELNADGSFTIGKATVQVQKTAGTPLNVPGDFTGTLTYNQAIGSYTLTVSDGTAAISVAYDATKTAAGDDVIGKAYTVSLSGSVVIDEVTYNLETNASTLAIASDSIKTPTAAAAAAFTVTGGTFNNEGTVVIYQSAKPVDQYGTFVGDFTTFAAATEIKGTMDGNITSSATAGTVTISGTLNGNIDAKSDVTVSKTMKGNITSSGNVTITGATAKLTGDVTMNNSSAEKKLTVNGTMKGVLTYNTKYNTVTSGTPVYEEFTASMTIDGTVPGLEITAKNGAPATASTTATGGYFALTAAPALATGKTVDMTVTEGKFAAITSIALPASYALTIESGVTIEVAKVAVFTINGGMKVSKDAIKNYELVTIPVKYGKLAYVMTFDIAEGYTVFSNVEYALSNCDENSELTVGSKTTVNANVAIKAGVKVYVDNVELGIDAFDLSMGEGAQIILLGNAKVTFAATGSKTTSGVETLYYINGTIVYEDDNVITFDDVRFDAASSVTAIAATSTSDEKLGLDLHLNDGTVALVSGLANGAVDLNNLRFDLNGTATKVSGKYTVALGATSETAVTDAAEVTTKGSEVPATIVVVNGVMKANANMNITGSYAGLGGIILADGKIVSVAEGALVGVNIGNGTDSFYLMTDDGEYTVTSVAKTTSVDAYMKVDGILNDGAITAIGNTAVGTLTLGYTPADATKEEKVGAIQVPEASTLTVLSKLTANGVLGNAGTLYYKTEDTPSYGTLEYEITFQDDGYTVYTMLNTALDLIDVGTEIVIEKDLEVANKTIPLGVSIVIADGHYLTVSENSYLIIGVDATELGAGETLAGAVVLKNGAYVIDFVGSDSEIGVYTDADLTKAAAYNMFLVDDVAFATVYAFKSDMVLDLTPAAGDIDLNLLVPEIEGYYFDKWTLQNGITPADGQKLSAGPFIASIVASKVSVIFATVAGINYYVDGEIINTLDAPVKCEYGATVTAKISDTSKYQGTPLVNGKAYILIDDEVSKVTGSGVNPIPVPPEPEPEPVVGDSGLSLTDILLIVLVILIAIMVVILVLRLNRS